jgi:acyl-CoA thioesterase-1
MGVRRMSHKENSGIVYQGNLYRLKKLMKLAKQGGEFTIGFIGGSITQGSLATAPTKCYAYLVYEWWTKTFPQSKFHYVNGGIGATNSLYGAARAWRDVLVYRPDFVVVDFSVNDESTSFFQETYEGVIRKVYAAEKSPAVLVLNNVFYDTGVNAQDYHNEIAKYYQIPCVSMKESLYAQIIQGTLERSLMTQDNLHPNDKGHALLAEELTALLEAVYQDLDIEDIKALYPKQPFTANRYENAKLYQIQNSVPILDGFHVDTREKTGMLDLYKNGWIGGKRGDSITFKINASVISIQYLKSITKPRPVAEAIIDGDKEHAVKLDANFEETWGDCLYLQNVWNKDKKEMHEVEIKIIESHEDDKGFFYLVSLITD